MDSHRDFLYGVNLGGWLVLERWMTPSVFAGTDAIDEYTFMQTPGALSKLRRHHREFIREEDFQWLVAHGVNAIRIPVGYWAIAGDAPYKSCIGRLDWAFRMAEKYGLKVLLSFHGAPGSQNGHDHSGRVGRAEWYDELQHREDSVRYLLEFARRYRHSPALWGIELLNEPRTQLRQGMLKRFYRQSYRALQEILPNNIRIIFHDAFTPLLLNGALRRHRNLVVMDIHWYHFTAAKWLPLWAYFLLVRYHGYLLTHLSRRQPVIVGEWSGVLRHDKLEGKSTEQKETLRAKHRELQLRAYSRSAGWFYWSYKTEEPSGWNFRSLVENGSISIIK